ncbi:MAG TPA: Ig-like domain-containing protein [Gemmatimonadaceae bacterium]|nr:Ig-like domain-containing protein [Gemmatimonadaceae bacterium]
MRPFLARLHRHRSLAALVGAIALAAACSDSSTAPKQRGTGDLVVTLSPSDVQVDVGSTTTLTATVTDANGAPVRDARIFWSSEDTALATVSASGVVTARQPGAVHIAASVSGHSGIAKVTIVPKAVGSVTVTPASAKLTVGTSTNLAVALFDAGGQPLTGRDVAWKSSDEAVASVDANGRVTALAPGAAIVTATSEGRSASAAITVVPVAVGAVSIAPSSAAIVVGQSTQLTANVTDVNGAPLRDRFVAWSSSNDQIATVSSSGLVVARAVGTVTITATVEAKSATASVSVGAVPVGAVTISPALIRLNVGEQMTVTTIITDASGNVLSGRPVTFSSDAPAIATVSAGGVVRGVSPGTTTIRAESEGRSGVATVTVSPVPVASVSVSPPSASLVVGTTTTLTATVKDASGNTLSGRAVSWTTSNAAVATVSASGVVSAVAPGTAIITATSEGKSDQSTITVTPVPVASITVTPTSATLVTGQTVQLTATVKDAAGNVLSDRTVTWSTSDPFIALVSGSGLVTGVNAGTATITATVEGKQATATIVVQPVPVATVTVAPSTATVTVGQTVQLSATVKDASGNVLSDRTVTWTTSDAAVATVSSSGLVTGVGVGTATITATSEGHSATAAITVQAVAVASVSISPKSATVKKTKTVTFTAACLDASGNALGGRVITFTTSNAKVAKINSVTSTTATVQGIAKGTATITATCESKSASATIQVTD